MSIFVDTLSFANAPADIMMHLRDAGKIAVLLGSVFSGILGTILILMFSKKKKTA